MVWLIRGSSSSGASLCAIACRKLEILDIFNSRRRCPVRECLGICLQRVNHAVGWYIDFKLVNAVKAGDVAVDGEFSSPGSNQLKAG